MHIVYLLSFLLFSSALFSGTSPLQTGAAPSQLTSAASYSEDEDEEGEEPEDEDVLIEEEEGADADEDVRN